jgi:uncharacterized membrane protein YbaN (DUF454 family)
MKRRLKTIGGFLLVIAGIVGLLLPVVPGILFLAAGAFWLAPTFPVIQRLLDRVTRQRATR